MVMALAGNKADLEDKRKVTTEVRLVLVVVLNIWHIYIWVYSLMIVIICFRLIMFLSNKCGHASLLSFTIVFCLSFYLFDECQISYIVKLPVVINVFQD